MNIEKEKDKGKREASSHFNVQTRRLTDQSGRFHHTFFQTID